MEITETKNEGLKRAYKITVPNADIELRVKNRLGELPKQLVCLVFDQVRCLLNYFVKPMEMQ